MILHSYSSGLSLFLAKAEEVYSDEMEKEGWMHSRLKK
jgi:hypothetical protein